MSTNDNGYRYELTADVEAPVARVWDAWTVPADYEAWSGAVKGTTVFDVRPGGKWESTMSTPDGQEFPMSGTFPVVNVHERLDTAMEGFGDEPELMRLDLTDLGEGRTRITLSQTCATKEGHDMSKEGSKYLLDWCVAYVTSD